MNNKCGCVFCNIAKGTEHTQVYYKDDLIIAFRTKHSRLKVHTLVIPKVHIENLTNVDPGDGWLLRHMLVEIAKLGNQQCPNGFRINANNGKAANQTVFHLHFHIRGGMDLGEYSETGVVTNSTLYKDGEMIVYSCSDSNFKLHIVIELLLNRLNK